MFNKLLEHIQQPDSIARGITIKNDVADTETRLFFEKCLSL